METNISSEASVQGQCVECNGTFPFDEMIRHGAVRVCANCKPLFMQKLAEGAFIDTGKIRYAGFWRRFGAVLLDGILLWIVNTGLQMLVLFRVTLTANPDELTLFTFVVIYAIGLTTGLCYEGILVAKYGATLGKMACRIKVVTPDGGPISVPRSIGRHFAKYLSGIILAIGYIIAAFDTERRSLHDHICNTRVVLT
jgi:uncharacterized RDD family membrane protein YckC